ASTSSYSKTHPGPTGGVIRISRPVVSWGPPSYAYCYTRSCVPSLNVSVVGKPVESFIANDTVRGCSSLRICCTTTEPGDQASVTRLPNTSATWIRRKVTASYVQTVPFGSSSVCVSW